MTTIREALSWAQQQFPRESARLDAEVLLARCLQRDRTYLYTWPEKVLNDQVYSQWCTWVARRAQGEPVAYILGCKEFWSLQFLVNSRTLIPRPETELLVERLLEQLADPKQARLRILDLGTGTGAIALALATEMPNSQLVATDYSAQVVELAEQNRRKHNCQNVQCLVSDWYSAVEGRFDWIVSNPPYIDSQDVHLTQGDVTFEPASALVATDNGLADLREIISRAPNYLRPGGGILLEHGWQQSDAVSAILMNSGFANVNTALDFAGHPRITGGVYVAG